MLKCVLNPPLRTFVHIYPVCLSRLQRLINVRLINTNVHIQKLLFAKYKVLFRVTTESVPCRLRYILDVLHAYPLLGLVIYM